MKSMKKDNFEIDSYEDRWEKDEKSKVMVNNLMVAVCCIVVFSLAIFSRISKDNTVSYFYLTELIFFDGRYIAGVNEGNPEEYFLIDAGEENEGWNTMKRFGKIRIGRESADVYWLADAEDRKILGGNTLFLKISREKYDSLRMSLETDDGGRGL